jgi:hypothetical protein
MLLDLEALKAAPVNEEPFPHLVVPFFLPQDYVRKAIEDYPKIDMAGIFPLETVDAGSGFWQVVRDMQSEAVRDIIAEKFGMDLSNHERMVTVRACCRSTDGKIHADATFKKATLLLYLNEPEWQHEGGRLRVLRSPDNLEDYAGEVAPVGGLLFAFKCVPHAWHGHHSYSGIRRYIMMNFVEDPAMLKREVARHKFSATVKKVKRAFGFGKVAGS